MSKAEKWFNPKRGFDGLDDRPWLVRDRGTKLAVGIFVCPIADLAELIDEFTDPSSCQITKGEYGGVYFGNNFKMPNSGLMNKMTDEQIETFRSAHDGISYSEGLSGSLFWDRMQWVDLEAAIAAAEADGWGL